MSSSETILYSLLGGIIPALLWLFYWLHEDSKSPEPRGRIIETFLAGMIAVVVVLPFQKVVANIFPYFGVFPFALWALLEEGFKFIAAYIVAIRSVDDDEPIDSLIYMLTAALGFVALENTLFIWNPLSDANFTTALLTGGTRFIGASLLHIVASGTVGVALALSFYKTSQLKIKYALSGLALATLIHTIFNLFILRSVNSNIVWIFATVWVGIVLLLLYFEKVKTIAR